MTAALDVEIVHHGLTDELGDRPTRTGGQRLQLFVGVFGDVNRYRFHISIRYPVDLAGSRTRVGTGPSHPGPQPRPVGHLPGQQAIQFSREHGRRNYLDAVLRHAALGFQTHDNPSYLGMIGAQVTESLEMVGRDPPARLGFDRHVHITDDEVHFDSAGEPPVGQIGERLVIRAKRDELVVHPVLEGLAE